MVRISATRGCKFDGDVTRCCCDASTAQLDGHWDAAPKVLLRGCLAALAALTFILAPLFASAQDSVGAVAEGKALAAQAVKDAQACRYVETVDGFQRAYALNPNPSYLYNIATVLTDAVQDPARAYPWAVRYLTVARNDKERGEARDLLQKLDAVLGRTLGKLEVTSTPADARIYLDRKAPDTLLLHAAWVTPGSHIVLAEAAGYQPAQSSVVVAQGAPVSVALVLVPTQTVLRVESRTKDASVFVDGLFAGIAPQEVRTKAGSHLVRAEAAGHKPLDQEVTLAVGQTLLVRADLIPVAIEVPPPVQTVAAKRGMSPRRIGAWSAMGVGIALVAAGSVSYGLAYRDFKQMSSAYDRLDPNSASVQDEYRKNVQPWWDSATTKRIAALTCLTLGGAALASGLVLYFLPESKVTVAPGGPGGAGLSALVRW